MYEKFISRALNFGIKNTQKKSASIFIYVCLLPSNDIRAQTDG